MYELPPDDPRLNPMPDELDSPDEIVVAGTTSEVFHLAGGPCDNHDAQRGTFSKKPRNTLPNRRPCKHCLPSCYPDDNDTSRSD